MRYLNFFQKSAGLPAELQQPLNSTSGSIQDEKHVIIPIDEFENVEVIQELGVETLCERLDLIKEKLVNAELRIKDQYALEAKITSNVSVSQINLGLSGIFGYGFYKVIPIIQNWKSVVAQAYQDYYIQPISNQTCYQINGDPYCRQPHHGFVPESLINVLGNQIQSFAINATQVCQEMGTNYCSAVTSKNWSAFGGFFMGLVATTSLGISYYYAHHRKKSHFGSSCVKPKSILAREILSEEDQEFLSKQGINVGHLTAVQIVRKLDNKKIDLRIKKRPNYAPAVFNQITREYLNSNDRKDLVARQFMSSFN